MRLEVWPNHPVAAHLGILIGLVIIEAVAEIAPVGPVNLALGVNRFQCFIVPIPDAAALETRVGIDHFPELIKISAGIAFGVSVLAHHQRPFFVGVSKYLSLI